MNEYLNKTQKELNSLLDFKFDFSIRFSDLFGLFKKDKNVIKKKTKRIRKKYL